MTARWSTTEFEINRDLGICWWGTWCCCLLSSQNSGIFGFGSNFTQAFVFIVAIVLSIVLFKINALLGVIFLVTALISHWIYRVWMRSKIRESLSIPPSPVEDLFLHCFCPCCLVCQEAREAKSRGLDPTDFFCGEKLVTLEPVNENLTSSKFCITEEDSSTLFNKKSLFSEILSVSKTSKIILISWCFLALISVIVLIWSKRAANIGVLLLVFVQPILVFYFVYWRSRRQFASLDFVIKMFICGFFFATIQSYFLEIVLQLAVLLFMLILFFIVGLSNLSLLLSIFESSQLTIPSTTQDVLIWLSKSIGSNAVTNQNDASSDKETMGVVIIFTVAVIYSFLNAFVVAASVEEMTKFFVVKCCSFPRELREPDTALVYLMMAALGFATAENIEYVFGTKVSPIPHTSLIVGELFVLLIRVLMPIHLICSVLQASNLSKNITGLATLNNFQILLPAILLHGTYDFALFVMGFVSLLFKVNDLAMTIVSIAVPILITLAGILWAYFSFSSVTSAYKAGFRRTENADIDEVVVDGIL